jgi:outer membrane murein-binding lipoprotein Lpp
MLTRPHRAVMQLSALGVGALLLLNGCDFWPPALQAQIEQLHSEAQQSAADKALLQNQLNAANKAKEELQIRVEDLTRVNKEKSAMIAHLEHTIAATREHAVKAAKSHAVKPTGKAAVKKPLKSGVKATVRSSGKSTSAKKTKPAPTRRSTTP